jgi:DNA-binding LytR/AlgR family response regulator
MNSLQCLVVDDEPLAAKVIEKHIQDIPFLEMAGVCHDALAAMEFLKKNQIEVLILDIHMPKLKGLDLLRILTNKPKVILTTAYHQYALEGFELEVVDYLLKPVEFDRFLKAVNRLLPDASSNMAARAVEANTRPFRFFKANRMNIKVYLDEVRYIEGSGDYVKIHYADKYIMVQMQLSEVETYIASDDFLRIHRSFLVPIPKIDAYSSSEVVVEGVSLPIGRHYKMQALERLEKIE